MADIKPTRALRDVKVTLISAKDIKKGSFFKKQTPTAQIRVTGSNLSQVSYIGSGTSTSPVWNQDFVFSVEESAILSHSASVIVTIFSSLDLSGKTLGAATIPLFRCIEKVGEPQFGMYHVVKSSGKNQGSLNVSVTVFGEPFPEEHLRMLRAPQMSSHAPPQGYGAPSVYPQAGHMGYPAAPGPAAYYQQGHPAAYPGAQPPGYYQGGYQGGGYNGGQHGGYHEGYGHQGHYGQRGRQGGGMGGMGMGMGAGLLVGGLGGLLVADALTDGGGCGGGGCGGGGCGG